MSDFKIIGNANPVVGVVEHYTVNNLYPKISVDQNFNLGNPSSLPQIKWEVYVLELGKWRKTKENDKIGNLITYKFRHGSLTRAGIRIVAIKGDETAQLDIKPLPSKPKIDDVKLLDKSGKKVEGRLAYGQTVKARVHCLHMEKQRVYVTLWEDDVKGAGHSKANETNFIETKSGIVKDGIADVDFLLKPSFSKIATKNGPENDKVHEYYVTAGLEKVASNNVNVNEPEAPVKPHKAKTIPIQPTKPSVPTGDSKTNSPKSTTPAAPKKAKAQINSVNLTDTAGHQIKGTFREKQIKVWINSTGLKGKKIRLKLYDDDITSNDLLFQDEFTLGSDLHAIVVPLNTIPRSLGGNYWTEGSEQELFAEVEVLQTDIFKKSVIVDVDATVFKQDPVEVTNKVKKVGGNKRKEKFEKVKEKAEEAIIYISSEIATEIKIDKKDNIISFPDNGGYNGMKEYKKGDKIYCKKQSNEKSAFPLYKAYIYRGNKKGEALRKLRQDIDNKLYENAEATILNIARHAQTNNKNYEKEGPLPPNTIDNLYSIRYKQGWNNSKKESFRYRIVDNSIANFKKTEDITKEVSSGTMSLGKRSSISIDPWNSKGLIGCIGIRSSDGNPHSSCNNEYSHQDKENYKFIYHALNNYLETIIPELTGVYGRRGYSSNDGKVTVIPSTYKEEIKVYVLVDPLPELDNCKCKLKGGRELFYEEFGEAAIKMVEGKGKSNKFKALYIISQRRQENGFNLKVPLNNPMNIKDSGDLGKSDLYTREVINGKEIYINDGFGKFSTVEKGFEGYSKLLDRNFNVAYNAIFDDSKTVDDFLEGMQDKGKNGAYATDPNYKTSIKELFMGVVKDYKELLNCKLGKEKTIEGKNKIKNDIELLNKLK